MLTFKVLSLILRYPTVEIHEALPGMHAVVEAERLLPRRAQRELSTLIEELARMDLASAQERYVELFDRGRKLSLHVFEHTHGESRERGPAMVQLMSHYQQCGFSLAARELPDYVPLILEFLAEQPLAHAREMLAEAMPVIVLLGARLRRLKSAYAAAFEALEAIGGSPGEAAELRRQVAEEGPDPALVDMDRIWEEEAVTFTRESALGRREAHAQPIEWHPRMGAAGKTPT
jgi:nitrate reductase molybdenum cofactor assembly chaperone NarJ/NarW